MINYLIKTEIGGIEIRLVYSEAPNMFYVLYGLEQKDFSTLARAKSYYDISVKHALECAGY